MKKIVLFFMLLFALALIPSFCNAATTSVDNSQDLLDAVNNARSGDVINLTANIAITEPIEITGKVLTINGNGHTLTRNAENWTTHSQNGTLVTAGGNGTKVNLVNISLVGSEKYGVQAYNGGYVILHGVTISDCGYGGVLVNAGTVEIKNLTLNKNGKDSNNGIELAKGYSVDTGDNEPTLIMNGKLNSSEKENVIYIAINDKLSTFEVENAEGTENKLFINGSKVVVTDVEGNILYVSNSSDVEILGQEYVEPEPEPEPEPEVNVKDETPKTGIQSGIELATLIMFASLVAVIVLKKQ